MKITEINRYDDFLALEDSWNNVLKKSNHSFFSTWEWLSTWWKHYGDDKRLIILLAHENDEIVGIAPLMCSNHQMFGARMKKIEFIGTPDTDYCNFITTKKSEECINLFINYLHDLSENWDCIDLGEIPANAECLSVLSETSKELIIHHKCPYIPLPDSYEKFLSWVKTKQRSNLRRVDRRLKKEFNVECADYSGIDSINSGMNILFDLNRKRWMSRGGAGAFAEKKFRSFNLDVAKKLSEKKWLGLYMLKLSGNIVAAEYGFKYNNKYYSYLNGFDPRYHKFSVGNMLRGYLIQNFIQDGLVEFDFLRGAENYKYRWNAIDRPNSRAILIREGILSATKYWMYKKYWRQGKRVKYYLKIK